MQILPDNLLPFSVIWNLRGASVLQMILTCFAYNMSILHVLTKVLQEFIAAHNHHVISTEGSSTPLQLFHAYRHLTELHSSFFHTDPYPTLNIQNLLNNYGSLLHVEVRTRTCPLSAENFFELQETIARLTVSLGQWKGLVPPPIITINNINNED